MIGDRPNTDIALANNAGIASCLVMTGIVKNEQDLQDWIDQDINNKPNYIIESLGDEIENYNQDDYKL